MYFNERDNFNCSTILSAEYAVQVEYISDTPGMLSLAELRIENCSTNTLYEYSTMFVLRKGVLSQTCQKLTLITKQCLQVCGCGTQDDC